MVHKLARYFVLAWNWCFGVAFFFVVLGGIYMVLTDIALMALIVATAAIIAGYRSVLYILRRFEFSIERAQQ